MILVVGGAGYIGSHMAKRLRQLGEEHIIFDNLERGHRAAIGSSPFIQGDLRQPDQIKKAFAENSIDTVMHFSSYIEVGESVKDPAAFWDNNVTGTLNLLEAMREAGVHRIVFSSTAAVYGEPEQVPIPEDHPKRPESPYGWSKLAVEQVLSSYAEAYGLNSVCLRYFNAAAADPEGELGEDHRPETHLIPRILLAAQGRAPEIKIFGTDYATLDGTCIRDYIHVWDLAEAHWKAIQYLRQQTGGSFLACNLGYGHGYSVREVIEAAREVTGEPIPAQEVERRPGDPAQLIADSRLAQERLGWVPQHDNLRQIIQHAWTWMQANPGGYQ